MMNTLRYRALDRLAYLSLNSDSGSLTTKTDLAKLLRRSRPIPSKHPCKQDASQDPPPFPSPPVMVLSDLELLLALCNASSSVKDATLALSITHHLSQYLPLVVDLQFCGSNTLLDLELSPWELLTFSLTRALLHFGVTFTTSRSIVVATLDQYVNALENLIIVLSHSQPLQPNSRFDLLIMVTSLIGFLRAASELAHFWDPSEQLILVNRLISIFDASFESLIEACIINLYTESSQKLAIEWACRLDRYASSDTPIGPTLVRSKLALFIKACAISLAKPCVPNSVADTFEFFFEHPNHVHRCSQIKLPDKSITALVSEIALVEVQHEEDNSFTPLAQASDTDQKLLLLRKACIFSAYLFCSLIDPETCDPSLLVGWAESILLDGLLASNVDLVVCVMKSLAILSAEYTDVASTLSQVLPRLLAQGVFHPPMNLDCAKSIALIIAKMPKDLVISTLYSLGNAINSSSQSESEMSNATQRSDATSASPIIMESKDCSYVQTSIVQTIVCLAHHIMDEKITSLAFSMLIQKIGKTNLTVDACIISESAILSVDTSPSEFQAYLNHLVILSHDSIVASKSPIRTAVSAARNYLSVTITGESVLFEIYLFHLLDTISSKGDQREGCKDFEAELQYSAAELADLIQPLAVLMSRNSQYLSQVNNYERMVSLERDAWFNLVIHNFTFLSSMGKRCRQELQLLACYCPPLTMKDKSGSFENNLELNTVLRRGKGTILTNERKQYLNEMLPSCEGQIKALSHNETIYLSSVHFLEVLRARSRDCASVVTYFVDPRLQSNGMGDCMQAIAEGVITMYVTRSLSGTHHSFPASQMAKQLAILFSYCCHKISRVQTVAASCADYIINKAPSYLCQKTSLFALLNILSLMWQSCFENERDEYNWSTGFRVPEEDLWIELSDDFNFRRQTLNNIRTWAKVWLTKAVDIAPIDVKELLQLYLSESGKIFGTGEVSLGQSIALEMGLTVPLSDERYRSRVSGGMDAEWEVGTTGDFLQQFMNFQEFKCFGRILGGENDGNGDDTSTVNGHWQRSYVSMNSVREEVENSLNEISGRIAGSKIVTQSEVSDVLRRAGALVCKSDKPLHATVNHLVGIPFTLFTKESIQLGISVWSSVIQANHRVETRILAEIMEQFLQTVQRGRGIFDKKLNLDDPFSHKLEFAPSNRKAMQEAHKLAKACITPHLLLVRFLSSNFHASHLSNCHIHRMYIRFMISLLEAMDLATDNPLARETYLLIVRLGSDILQRSPDLSVSCEWRLWDRVLDAGLAWFKWLPQWTFGSDRRQVKEEIHLLDAIRMELYKGNFDKYTNQRLPGLQSKVDLLNMLLLDEQSRLFVWLQPLDMDKKHMHISASPKPPVNDGILVNAAHVGWAYDAQLAINLCWRYTNRALIKEVRWLVVNNPEKALNNSRGVELMLGQALPTDLTFQLKYLLYWAPVTIVTAVVYFLPNFSRNKFVLQYAMRSLHSQPVSVSFSYVPQIVQALRHDTLNYMERYIIDTAKSSQLFAHQVIWNMKANAYKDEESHIPDPMKGTLDRVTEHLIGSFNEKDLRFYEREFDFFGKVTSISGKLKPYIKRSKLEKKQKIEEELRKIKLEVGVYLPSNPDGIVIGIDRKSGKPLQSHAKAPFMATFHLRKEEEDEAHPGVKVYTEHWQSAIFKVGDDCRQDVLVLQLIAAFRGVVANVGLDVYVYPYRVTATEPGCGIIDVLPNAISRDMLGREAVNGLYDYFITKYGGLESAAFQRARGNFVKSTAAYSVLCYLLQLKDRHNGNIMIDDAGHMIHIDFGFCFDIAPGGIKFERAPFKLTPEMIAVMGGETTAQSYMWFEELCVKSFLACRVHCEHFTHIIASMMEMGLPCFKAETIDHFRQRFVLDRTDREAAEFMRDLIRKSHGSYSTKGYDYFQLLTNGIPY